MGYSNIRKTYKVDPSRENYMKKNTVKEGFVNMHEHTSAYARPASGYVSYANYCPSMKEGYMHDGKHVKKSNSSYKTNATLSGCGVKEGFMHYEHRPHQGNYAKSSQLGCGVKEGYVNTHDHRAVNSAGNYASGSGCPNKQMVEGFVNRRTFYTEKKST